MIKHVVGSLNAMHIQNKPYGTRNSLHDNLYIVKHPPSHQIISRKPQCYRHSSYQIELYLFFLKYINYYGIWRYMLVYKTTTQYKNRTSKNKIPLSIIVHLPSSFYSRKRNFQIDRKKTTVKNLSTRYFSLHLISSN